ncbi:MAG: RNA-binding protein, partial [Rhodospirillales bacterium]|nr:RNA-binding protein [Rhodospirillales bacterium]
RAEEPERRCLATGARQPREGLIRFAISPDGKVVPDVDEKLPGRGLWLSAARDMVNTACAKGLFARAAKARVDAPADLADQIERLLARRCLDIIGLARRAGQVEAGYEKVRAMARSGNLALLLAAVDGAPDGRRKVRALAPEVPLLELFSAAELGHATGREHAVHVGIARGRLAERLENQARRLAGFRNHAGEDENGAEGD